MLISSSAHVSTHKPDVSSDADTVLLRKGGRVPQRRHLPLLLLHRLQRKEHETGRLRAPRRSSLRRVCLVSGRVVTQSAPRRQQVAWTLPRASTRISRARTRQARHLREAYLSAGAGLYRSRVWELREQGGEPNILHVNDKYHSITYTHINILDMPCII